MELPSQSRTDLMTTFEPLSANDLAVLRALIVQVPGRLGDEVAAQLRHTQRESGVVTMVELAVDVDAPRAEIADGPLPGRALVEDSTGLIGELMVWIKSGHLSMLEYAWYTDDVPTALPTPDQIRFA
jgi:hypothetical protein